MARNMLRAAAAACLFAGTGAVAQTLEIGYDQSPAGLDPHIATAFSTFAVINGTIYEGLTSIDKDLRLRPGLAESWTVSPDGKTYRFKLRSNVRFHDGTPMEAADVVASIERVLNKDIGSPLASRLAAVEGVGAIDATTVELRLKEAQAPLLVSIATIAIVPRRMQADKDSLQRQPVGTGPFAFAEWQPNSFIRLAKHAGYWGAGQPKLDGVKFNLVPESATRQVGLSGGTYAMLPNIDAATALQLQGRPNVRVVETLELAYTLVGLNVSKPPFNDARVRRALNHALDRAEIVQAAQFGKGVPGGPLSPALKDWAVDTKEFGCYTHDPARAAEPHLGFVRPTNNAGGLEGGMTNGMPVVVTGTMKPISTLLRGMPSVDLNTKAAVTSAYERSDISAIAAASVVLENVVAFEIARAFLEKFGGDSMTQLRASHAACMDLARKLPLQG